MYMYIYTVHVCTIIHKDLTYLHMCTYTRLDTNFLTLILSHPHTLTDGESGECFLVERYESDLEEAEEEGDQLLLNLSDQFLEEKDINGMVHVHACIYY